MLSITLLAMPIIDSSPFHWGEDKPRRSRLDTTRMCSSRLPVETHLPHRGSVSLVFGENLSHGFDGGDVVPVCLPTLQPCIRSLDREGIGHDTACQ